VPPQPSLPDFFARSFPIRNYATRVSLAKPDSVLQSASPRHSSMFFMVSWYFSSNSSSKAMCW
jgi:hypothetical protein